jgi:hypothetical protein
MVLVAPDLLRPPPGAEPEAASGAAGAIGAAALLARLREPTGIRTGFEGLAGGLRAWLEDAAFTAVTVRGEAAPPLSVGPRRLLAPPGDAPVYESVAEERVLARLVGALFRQLVTAAAIGDPLRDALDALRADRSESDVVRHVESLRAAERAALAEALAVHTAHLRALVPRFAPASMPRTDDRVAIPLAGGRVVLGGVFDLLVGDGGRGGAALSAVGLSVGGPPDRDRWRLHFLALLQTLRCGTPPIRLALLHTATGVYGVEDVRAQHLCAAATHVAAWLGGCAGTTADG